MTALILNALRERLRSLARPVPGDFALPKGFMPRNIDGEVPEFRLMDPDELAERILAGEFTEDAAAVASCWLLGSDPNGAGH
ncbi:hypothetical protein [Azoarcus taiwanensis]|uniref:Uncharacterized protein n=1 Tax=Azoarcus taiwanensis TaxID=666964 RepID=A0A972F904_9RHOO|nr:hypothetical protein [Azoarcus taiwanensis]NMG04451.1 hypothetical protein [Azoarcus taiwanensis]